MLRPSSCSVKAGIPSSQGTYLHGVVICKPYQECFRRLSRRKTPFIAQEMPKTGVFVILKHCFLILSGQVHAEPPHFAGTGLKHVCFSSTQSVQQLFKTCQHHETPILHKKLQNRQLFPRSGV